MNLENIEQIVNGVCAMMPSGIEAEISMDNNGTIYVKYDDECCDTYTQDEFGRLMKDGIQVLETPTIEEQSVLMENKLNEISDELVDKVSQKRLSNFVNSKMKDKNTRQEARKLRKNAELVAKRDERKQDLEENKLLDMVRLEKIANGQYPVDIKQNAQSLLDNLGIGIDVKEDVKKFLDKLEKKETYNMSILKKLTEQVNGILNEISDDIVWSAYNKRWSNTTDAINKTADAKRKLNKAVKDKDLDNIEDAEKEYDDAVGEHQKAKQKLDKNIDLTLDREIRKQKQKHETFKKRFGKKVKNEEFEDTMSMLTDINDLDFPQEFADTVDTTEDGEVVTLGTVLDAVNDVKDELNAKVDSLEMKVDDIVNDSQVDDVEFMDALDTTTAALADDIEDIQDDVADVEEDVDDLTDKDTEDTETEDTDTEDTEDTEEDKKEDTEEEEELEESFKKYLRKGKYVEDLNDTKKEIDKAVAQGKDVEEIKNEIVLGAEDEKEEEEAKEYAAEKLKESKVASIRESLLATKYTSKLSGLKK